MAKLGQLMNQESGKTPAYYGKALVNILENWTERLKIPRLGEYGITEGDLAGILDQTANRNHPIHLTRAEIQELLESRL